jgi:hypothetical protein
MNQQGITREQAQQQVQETSRANNADLANLAVVAQAAQGNYQGALDIVQRKLDAEFEPLDQQISILKDIYTMNQNNLSESQKIQLQETTRIKEEERANLQSAAETASKILLDNQAPASAWAEYDKATTPQGKLAVASKYNKNAQLDMQYRQAQINASNRSNQGGGGDGSGTITGKPQNAAQSSANGYADRLNLSNITLDTLGNKFTSVLSFGGSLPNILQSGDRQVYEQAKRNFVTAVLRRESGAAISSTEFDTEAKKYFPQAGDKPETVIAKSVARNTAINNVYREANVLRPVLPGMIVNSNGKQYRVGSDGETLEELKK